MESTPAIPASTSRLVGLAAVLGGLYPPLGWLILHPKLESDLGVRFEQLASSDVWRAVHFGNLIAYLLIALALRSILVGVPYGGGQLPHLAALAIVAGGAVSVVSIGIDGSVFPYVAEHAAGSDAWYSAALAINALNEWTFAASSLTLFGLAPLLLGLTLRAAGDTQVVGTLVPVISGAFGITFACIAFFVTTRPQTFVIFAVAMVVLSAWLVVNGARQLRSSR